MLTGQQCLPDTLRTASKCRCSKRCPVDISHLTTVSTALGRPGWCPEMASGLNASLRQVPHCHRASAYFCAHRGGPQNSCLNSKKKKMYTEYHIPAGKSWYLRVTEPPSGTDRALLCTGPCSGRERLSTAKDRQVLLRWPESPRVGGKNGQGHSRWELTCDSCSQEE